MSCGIVPPSYNRHMAQKLDVCIRGDGMVGRTLALLLARQKLRVGLVTSAPKTTQDVRAYSLNSASRDFLSEVRCWPDALHATPVQHMRVWGDDGGFTHFESPTPEGLTWIVDVPVLEAQLADAQKAVLLSMDSTLRSNLSVGMPLDMCVIERDACRISTKRRIEAGDEQFRAMSEAWSRALRDGFTQINI